MREDKSHFLLNGSLTNTEEGRRLYRPLLKRLLKGQPVERAEIAALLGWPLPKTEEFLKNFSALEFDEEGRLVGAGLSLRETPHTFEMEGRRLFTWCALDTLIFPAVLGKTAQITSRCAGTRALVRLTVSPEAVLSLEPSGTVVSLQWCCDGPDIRSSFCDHVHFFVSEADAASWRKANPGASVVPVSEAFQTAQAIARWILEA